MERIFVIIGRINSVLLLVALLGASALIFIGWMSWSGSPWQRRGAIEVPAAQDEKASPVFLQFGRVKNIPGANTQMMELTTEDKSGKFSSGGYANEIRNVLFLTGNEKKARWLFPTHSNLILAAAQLREDSGDSRIRERPISALYFEYVTSDTNGDKKLSPQDLSKVALAKPDGTDFVEVLDGVARVLSYEMLDSHRLTVIYQKGKSVHHARFSVITMTKELDHEIVSVPDRF